jgi:ectoine hydroxylase-related dioxygenase (phytanoyl-CoA dioxygenase family)
MFDLSAFERDGFACRTGAALPVLDKLEHIVSALPADQAGLRLFAHAELAQTVSTSTPIGAAARDILGGSAKPVRAILFDKSARNNWALSWHQDRTIAVRDQRAVTGFEVWSRKQGVVHVEPPFHLIESMVTLRIHLDPVDYDNAPLRVISGSHLLGKIAESEIEAVACQHEPSFCLASRGDIWVYRTAILHASSGSRSERRRRVLQLDYSTAELPGGLEWIGL